MKSNYSNSQNASRTTKRVRFGEAQDRDGLADVGMDTGGSHAVPTTSLAYHYPHISFEAQDHEGLVGMEMDTRESRVIPKVDTSCKAWGPPHLAAIRATLEEVVTAENEQLLRTYHPSLASFDVVVAEPDTFTGYYWRVSIRGERMGSTGKLETHAGGREIHVVPFLQVDPNCSGIFFEGPDPIPRQINPRRFLTAGDLNRIRRSFPTSSGIVVLMAGQAIILYRTQSDVNAAWRFPPILSIGGLGLQHSLDTREPSVAEVDSGSVVFNPDPSANQACAIGIKIKTPGGAQAITTVTHGFVRPNRALRNLKLTVYSWYSRFKNALSKFTSMRYPAMPAFITTKRSPLTNSPMGKEVFLLETNEQIGVIGTNYDNPSAFLPYPIGFSHDLSLITAVGERSLPDLVPPPGVKIIPRWASLSDALDGKEMFICTFKRHPGPAVKGEIADGETRRALIEGSCYHWDREPPDQSASILWRTAMEKDLPVSVAGHSGSVLCVGQPSAGQPLLFQNFEQGFKGLILKGGFILPEEIRRSDILLGSQDASSVRRDQSLRQTRRTNSTRKTSYTAP